ncbi:hypothetical protein M8494_09895 [Serratia ureilytica]
MRAASQVMLVAIKSVKRVDPSDIRPILPVKMPATSAVASNPLAIIEFLATACFSFCIMLLTFGR